MKRKSARPLKTSLNNRIDALLGGQKTEAKSQSSQTLPIESLKLPEYQPRQYFDEVKLQQLAVSISEHGILEPLLVRPLSNNKYELVAGGRRYRAARLASLTEVPVVILDLTDTQALEIAILENLQREELNPIEETEGILRLLCARLSMERSEVTSLLYRLRNSGEGGARRNVSPKPEVETVKEVFAPLGITWKSFIETRLPLLKLPEEIIEALRKGQLAYTKAKALASVKDKQSRETLLDEAVKQNLSLSEIKAKIKELQPKPESPAGQLKNTYRRVQKAKLWDNNTEKWQQVVELLKQIDALIEDKEDTE